MAKQPQLKLVAQSEKSEKPLRDRVASLENWAKCATIGVIIIFVAIAIAYV